MNEQMSLNFRTRNETKFRNTSSKDDGFSPKIDGTTTKRIIAHCSRENINKTKFVIWCVNHCLDELEREYYGSLEKEELIRLLLENK